MKSENILLTICLIVILIFSYGLTVQSCKSSSSLKQKSTLKVDSTGKQEKTSTINADSFFHQLLIDESNYEWNIETYIPTIDSAGHVTGSALISRKSGRKSNTKESIQAAAIKKKESSSNQSIVKFQKEDISQTEKSKQLNSHFSVSYYIILLVIIGFIYIRIRCPTLPTRIMNFFRSLF